MTILRCSHFCPILPNEHNPLLGSCGFLCKLHGLSTRSKIWEPNVVPVLRGELGLRDASRWKTHGTDPNAFTSASCAPKSHDTDGHVIFQRCAVDPGASLVLSCPSLRLPAAPMGSVSQQGAQGLSGYWFPEHPPGRGQGRADEFQMPSAPLAPP